MRIRSNLQKRIPQPPSLLPISVLADSYKATHYLQYPSARTMVAVSS